MCGPMWLGKGLRHEKAKLMDWDQKPWWRKASTVQAKRDAVWRHNHLADRLSSIEHRIGGIENSIARLRRDFGRDSDPYYTAR